MTASMMSPAMQRLPRLTNSQPIALADVPNLDFADFRTAVVESVGRGNRLAAFFGQPLNGVIRLYAVLTDKSESLLSPLTTDVVGDEFPSLTPDCPQAHNFEREIAEQWGLVPLGHPWLKPLRYHHSYRPGHDVWNRLVGDQILPCVTQHFQVAGSEIHEVAVGPVHAGV